MAPRVHSTPASTTSPPPASTAEKQRKVFTVWMKSLVLHGHGCTVYDSGGGIVYRVDNYGDRCSGSVCLMDVNGAVVLTLVKKQKLAFGRWEGYKWRRGQKQEPTPWFTVTRPPCRPFQYWGHGRRPASSSSWCEFRCDTTGGVVRYAIAGERRAGSGKPGCRIVDEAIGGVVAEVKRKVTASGVALGEDVLSLVVAPGTDLSLVVGIVLSVRPHESQHMKRPGSVRVNIAASVPRGSWLLSPFEYNVKLSGRAAARISERLSLQVFKTRDDVSRL